MDNKNSAPKRIKIGYYGIAFTTLAIFLMAHLGNETAKFIVSYFSFASNVVTFVWLPLVLSYMIKDKPLK